MAKVFSRFDTLLNILQQFHCSVTIANEDCRIWNSVSSRSKIIAKVHGLNIIAILLLQDTLSSQLALAPPGI